MKITRLETLRLGEFPNLVWLRVHTDAGVIATVSVRAGPWLVQPAANAARMAIGAANASLFM